MADRRHLHFRMEEGERDKLLSSLRSRGIGWQHIAQAFIQHYFTYEKNARRNPNDAGSSEMYQIILTAVSIRAASYKNRRKVET